MRFVYASLFMVFHFCLPGQGVDPLESSVMERDLRELDQFRQDLYAYQHGDSSSRQELILEMEREIMQSKERLLLFRTRIGTTRVHIANDMQAIRTAPTREVKQQLKKDVRTKVKVYRNQENVLDDLEKRTAQQIKLHEEVLDETDEGKVFRRFKYFEQTMSEDISDRRYLLILTKKVDGF